MARVKFEPTQEQRDNVELLAAVGTKHDIIARMIVDPATGRHISDKTLRKYFRDELELGLAKANAIVGRTLFDMATSGHEPGMTAFWMKTRAGYKETDVTQTQTLGANGEPVNPPPMFGISWADGGPGHPVTASSEANGETVPQETADDAAEG